jgi:hypothetical protein
MIRDREVGGSNPLAPTIFLHPVKYLPSLALTVLFHRVANLWTNLFDFGQLKRPTGSVTSANKPPKNVVKLNLVRRMVQFHAARNRALGRISIPNLFRILLWEFIIVPAL